MPTLGPSSLLLPLLKILSPTKSHGSALTSFRSFCKCRFPIGLSKISTFYCLLLGTSWLMYGALALTNHRCHLSLTLQRKSTMAETVFFTPTFSVSRTAPCRKIKSIFPHSRPLHTLKPFLPACLSHTRLRPHGTHSPRSLAPQAPLF